MKVELRYATLPSLLGLVASHYWFVVFDGGEVHRWEVWQTKSAGGRSIGHDPFCHKYCYWPGPNSNTFAAWALRKAGIAHTLGATALGKRFPVA